MQFGVRHRILLAWLAGVAIALQALWPLLAQAKPRSVTLVPVCTIAGETHYVELETGGSGGASHEEHCKACPVGAAALACANATGVPPSPAPAVLFEQEGAVATRLVLGARQRAPPSFLFVEVNFDQQEMNDEEAVALRPRGARDAVAGRGVVRRGVLLD